MRSPDASFISQSGVDLTNGVVDRADFSGANLSNAKLVNAVITGTTFVGANLEGADFEDALIGNEDAKVGTKDRGTCGAVLKPCTWRWWEHAAAGWKYLYRVARRGCATTPPSRGRAGRRSGARPGGDGR